MDFGNSNSPAYKGLVVDIGKFGFRRIAHSRLAHFATKFTCGPIGYVALVEEEVRLRIRTNLLTLKLINRTTTLPLSREHGIEKDGLMGDERYNKGLALSQPFRSERETLREI